MHRGQPVEKINDFKGTIIRLFKNLDRWKFALIIAIIFAISAAALSTVAPNKLADVTDVVTEGIKPNTKNIERVTKEIIKHSNIPMTGNYDVNNNSIDKFNNLSIEEKELLFNDFELDGVLITKRDQVVFLEVLILSKILNIFYIL